MLSPRETLWRIAFQAKNVPAIPTTYKWRISSAEIAAKEGEFPAARVGDYRWRVEAMDYDGAADILQRAIVEMFEGGYPKHDLPPLLADFTFMTAFASASLPGVSAVIGRIRNAAHKAEQGEYGEFKSADLAGLAAQISAALCEFDGAPVRTAMEHLLSHQGAPLDKAAAFVTVYALMLVFEHMGPDRADALVNTAARELRRMKAEKEPVNTAYRA